MLGVKADFILESLNTPPPVPLLKPAPVPLAMSPKDANVAAAIQPLGASSCKRNSLNGALIDAELQSHMIIDLFNNDDEDNRKMPATKKQRTVGEFHSKMEAEVYRKAEEEVEKRKQQESNAMFLSNSGRAFKLVETLIRMCGVVLAGEPAAASLDTTMELVGQDDIVFLAERFLECQQRLVASNKPSHVSIGYHYTKERNLRSIRQDGLLSHPERKSKNKIGSRRGAYFGDGVYTACNPYGFRHFGNTGLLCALLRGQEERVGPGGTSAPNVNTAVGNKNSTGNLLTEELILHECCQVLPILRFSSASVERSGSLIHKGNALLWKLHVEVQKILDQYFNGNMPTAVEHVTPNSKNDKVQTSSSSLGFAIAPPVPPLPVAAATNPGPPQPQPQTAFAASTATAQPPMGQFLAWNQAAPTSQTQSSQAQNAPQQIQAAAKSTSTQAELEMRRQKELFLMFTRVLMKFLETKDPAMHQTVKAIIKDCAERNKRQEKGYESVTEKMKERLKPAVTDAYWKRAEQYLAHFLAQKQKAGAVRQQQQALDPPGATVGTTTTAVVATAIATTTAIGPSNQAMTARSKSTTNSTASVISPSTLITSPTVQREVLCYVAPAQLVSAEECCQRVRTLSRVEDCSICLSKLHGKGRVLQIYSCGHLFHSDCISEALQHDSKCPKCRVPVSKDPQGRSPSGTMTISHSTSRCGGFPDSNGSIVMSYNFPSGTQLAYHETPGHTYCGSRRTAYLPNNAAGRQLLMRFKFAWSRGLLFGVGTSLTTGRSGQVVWSSVHQKTSMRGGAHGFPDPNYFGNANADLDALNVPACIES